MSASPRRIGSTSRGMSRASYWLSASVLTMMSAPRPMDSSSPAMKARASPWFRGSRRTWRTPLRRATSAVESVLPSSMTSHSTSSAPGISRGRSRSVSAKVVSSLKQGIWMTIFMTSRTDAPKIAPASQTAKLPHRGSRRRPCRAASNQRPRVLPHVFPGTAVGVEASYSADSLRDPSSRASRASRASNIASWA